MTTPNSEWIDFIRSIRLVTILKASVLLFIITLQVLAIIWIVMLLRDDTPVQQLPPVTTTITETTTTETTTP